MDFFKLLMVLFTNAFCKEYLDLVDNIYLIDNKLLLLHFG
jgi:hypothetical protein